MNQREEIIQRIHESLDFIPSSNGRRRAVELALAGARADRRNDWPAAFKRYQDAVQELASATSPHAKRAVTALEQRLYALRNAPTDELKREARYHAE